jgi:predicted nuclease of predicted toxin-antitoxin system
MGLARRTVSFLRSQGHDAIHLRDEGLQRLEDADIVEKARSERRVILTHDLDFGRIVALSGENIPTVVTFRLTDMRPDHVNLFLADVLDRFSEQLAAGALISVNEDRIRVRLLPVERTDENL